MNDTIRQRSGQSGNRRAKAVCCRPFKFESLRIDPLSDIQAFIADLQKRTFVQGNLSGIVEQLQDGGSAKGLEYSGRNRG